MYAINNVIRLSTLTLITTEDMKPSIHFDGSPLDENTLKTGDGLYKPATNTTLDTIRQRNQAGKATFLLASQPVFAESAQAAYLLCEYINSTREKDAKKIYKTFFCNSRVEALHGAIKISRHNARMVNSDSDGSLLIYDKGRYYDALFDPLSHGPDKALVPGVFFFDRSSDLLEHPDKPDVPVSAVVVCLYDDMPVDSLNDIQNVCKEKNTILVIDTSHASDAAIEPALKLQPDIVVWGEGMTDNQVPFGAFSVADVFYKPWCSAATCFLHSSTYGGNSLVTSIVRDRILNRMPISADVLLQLRNIADNPEARMAAFRSYINPVSPLIYKAAKLDLDIIRAKGSKITVKDSSHQEIELIDCIGGAGSNLRGYNPGDIVSRVLEIHDSAGNYWQELAGELCGLAGMDNAFPAVSGACAVDIAFTLAMLANSERSRILVFKGNYAGKTLISLNGTEDESVRKPFEPLYWDVLYLDIFSENAEAALLKELQSGQVALMWFEAMQGQDLDRVPSALLDIVFDNKKECGYFVGIDEILNGMFRTGPFVSFNQSRYEPDIVTLSKGLSDLTFPISATLISSEIYRRAKRANEGLVTRYEGLFLNQLGSHIALNGLASANELNIKERVRNVGNRLKLDLERIAERSPLLKEIRGEGLHLHLVLDMEKFPLSVFGKTVSELLISRLCLSHGHVLQYFCRLLPPLTISDPEVQALAAGIEKALEISRFSLFVFGLKHIFAFLYLLLMVQLKSGFARLVKRVAGFTV